MHPLADAAKPPEFLLLAPDHAVEQRLRLPYYGELEIAHCLGRAALEDRVPIFPAGILNRQLASRLVL